VFFKGSDSRGGLPGHVGIYIGGDKMIDAPHTGATVRVETVSTFPGYAGARRFK
jgi:cell wall-associated NlpC family hydrolase